MGAVTWVPESCTLPTAEQPLRVAELDDLFATAVRPAERLGSTALLMHLPAGDETAAAARDLIARETGCCSFFVFELRVSAGGTELEVRVPASHSEVLAAMQQRAEAAGPGGMRA
jgi:hypothetical protein